MKTKQDLIKELIRMTTSNLYGYGWEKEKIDKAIEVYAKQLEEKDVKVLKNLLVLNC